MGVRVVTQSSNEMNSEAFKRQVPELVSQKNVIQVQVHPAVYLATRAKE